jgi:hypothetical protein
VDGGRRWRGPDGIPKTIIWLASIGWNVFDDGRFQSRFF